MPSHEYFRSLCSRATDTQISPEELADLLSHVMECESCRDTYKDSLFATEKRPENTHSISYALSKDPADYDSKMIRERFLNRARAEGFRFSEEAEANQTTPSRVRPSLLKAQYGLGLAALLVVVLLGVWTYRWKTGQKAAVAELNAFRQKASELERMNGQLREDLTVANRQRTAIAKQFAELSNEISADQRERSIILARIRELQQKLKEAGVETQKMTRSAETSEAERKALDGELQDRAHRMAQMSEEIRKLRLQNANDEAMVKAQKQRVERLVAELKEQTGLLGRQNRLLAADRDVRDLMGARKLHVIDVYDANGEGNNRKAFGRVFYTEGKSLIFYAFDLGNPYHPGADFSFVGWGTRTGSVEPAKELGIFYVDDATQRRWVLKIDNPELLREINAVFVTVEPSRGSKRPTGQKLLYAFLDTQANHP